MAPSCEGGDYNSPEFKAKCEAGPNLVMSVLPNQCSMAPMFIQWFIYLLLVGLFTAYVAVNTLAADASGRSVLRIVGTVAILAHAAAQ